MCIRDSFTPTAPNQVWTSDITYLWTDEGWLYLAIVLDLFNREVVGWSLKPRMTADIVTDALTMAWFRKRPAAGLMHHSDRGSQYANHAFQDKLRAYGMTCSMSRKGNCWDNAPTESWFNSFKNEWVHGIRYASHADMKATSFEYIEVFYNRKRQHSTLGYQSPIPVSYTHLDVYKRQLHDPYLPFKPRRGSQQRHPSGTLQQARD